MNPGHGLRWLDALGPQKIRPGLARTRALLAALGNPQASFRTLLVGGTNGKGSTAAAAAVDPRGRGPPRRADDLAPPRPRQRAGPPLPAAMSPTRSSTRRSPSSPPSRARARSARPTSRRSSSPRASSSAAPAWRSRVVEVGIGGRLDATNVLDPEVSVVTNVEADHLETLGPSLADVAREKAGIFRHDQPALTAATGDGLEVLRTEAGRTGARLLEVPPSSAWDDVSPLPGAHQRANLALAVAAARAFAPLDDATVRRGIAAIRWPGRLQTVPRPGLRPLLVDGAHNPAGAAALAAHLDAAGLSGRVDLVFGALGDKAVEEMFAPLAARARRVVLVAPASPRAIPPDALAARLGRPGLPRAASLAEALAALEGTGARPYTRRRVARPRRRGPGARRAPGPLRRTGCPEDRMIAGRPAGAVAYTQAGARGVRGRSTRDLRLPRRGRGPPPPHRARGRRDRLPDRVPARPCPGGSTSSSAFLETRPPRRCSDRWTPTVMPSSPRLTPRRSAMAWPRN